ncbi:SMI1/KNR4 family protein [Streptomyces lushanensis]|uniref:SMI1/KNR4 family protein n=1 Tax=Streptomyces lushanensis TaxID=1434255 RepID=UPI00082F71FD|nr:SMI1/KNR4 family protein [Streptomyces lushanensis]
MTETEQLLTAAVAHVAASAHPGSAPLPAPATREAVARAEAALGFSLPPLLAGLYLRIADGGFGPGYGLLSLDAAVAAYLDGRGTNRAGAEGEDGADGDGDSADGGWGWPEGVFPLADWGCAMLACVDCRSEDEPVLLFEPNPGTVDSAWWLDSPGLAAWLAGWLDGTAWFEDEDSDMDLPPWPDYRARIAAPAGGTVLPAGA